MWSYEKETGMIQATHFPGYCVESRPKDKGTLRVMKCDLGESRQVWWWDGEKEAVFQGKWRSSGVCVYFGGEGLPLRSRLDCAGVDKKRVRDDEVLAVPIEKLFSFV